MLIPVQCYYSARNQLFSSMDNCVNIHPMYIIRLVGSYFRLNTLNVYELIKGTVKEGDKGN